MQYDLLTDLALAAGETRYSQAVEMGDDNTVKVHVVLLGATAFTGALEVTVEASEDLENWSDMMQAYQANYSTTPSSNYMPASAPMSAIYFRYVRLRVTNTDTGGIGMLLNATLSTHRMS